MNWEGKMLKKLGFTTAALFGLLLMGNAKPAKAEVHFGIYLGAPAYSYPVAPYAYTYPDPYVYGYSAPAYVYRAPAYVAPYVYGYRDRDRNRHEWRERQEHRRHEIREHRDRHR
jgi:hypothetical protein